MQQATQNYTIKEKSEFKGITNPRQLILKDLLDSINPLREKAGYKPYTPARLGKMLSHINTADLKVFYGNCRNAKNFTSFFGWRLKK